MVDKSKKNFEEELSKNLKMASNNFTEDLMKKFKENEKGRHQIIIDHIKNYFEPIFDKDFLLIYNNEKNKYYISLGPEGEEEYFSLFGSDKANHNEYDIPSLLDACLRELIRLWKLEKSMKVKGEHR